MATQLFVNVQAQSIGSALVRSATDLTPVTFPTLVVGDGREYELYFVDGVGGYASFSGDASFIPLIAIGECGYPTGGTFTLTFGGDETTALAYNASPAAVQTALQALASIGSGNVAVSGVAGKYYLVEFTGSLADTDVAEITSDFDGLLPASTIDVTTLVVGGGGNNEQQLLVLAVAPVTFADDWAPITNGWAGQLSARTLGVIQAFTEADGTLEQIFQVTLQDSLGVRTTYAKVNASIECTIINPESFAGADKPQLALQSALNAAVLGLNNFTRESVTNTTGNSNITRSSTSRHHLANVAVTGSASTRTLSILTTNSPNSGDVVFLVIAPDTTVGNVIEIRNATSGGTLLESITTDASAQVYLVLCVYSGSAWTLAFTQGDTLNKTGNLAGLASALTSRANLKTAFSRISGKTEDFTISASEDGTFFPTSTADGNVLATLPDPGTAGAGALLALQKVDASPFTLTTSPATITLSSAGASALLVSDGTAWSVALAYNPAEDAPTRDEVILNWDFITALTGGTDTDLDGQPTATGAVATGQIVAITRENNDVLATSFWALVDGTDAESATVIRPDDYDASTNARVWKLTAPGLNSYAAASNSSGNTTVTPTQSNHVEILTVTGSAGTRIVILTTTNQLVGNTVELRLNLPATASIVMEIRNGTAGGTLLYSLTTDGSGDDAYLRLYFDGTAWQPLANIVPVV
jgi:hypothetical protein